MNKFIAFIILLFTTAIGCSNAGSPTATINGTHINLEIANTPEKQTLGLSNRDSLDSSNGMLFDFINHSNKQPSFWMKDMKFNIDIIWIKDNKIIFISENVPAPQNDTDPLLHYQPPSEIDYVLEVNANLSKEKNWKVNDKVELQI